MTRLALLLLYFSFFSFLLSPETMAQDQPPCQKRKTVAVVLSGGGAKGVAHIGVLKALEDQGIPIDYIAGTSIGAMVGGMYAAGYSPDQILELMNSREFEDASMGILNKKYDYYYFQNDPKPAWITFNYSLNNAFNISQVIRENLPSNLVSPGMMDFMFMQYLGRASAAANNNFDSLYIPFRCIASDITNKRAVILKRGSLAEAVRASMTFPFYFKPIAIDGMVLFDGGMFNNFPADIAMQDFKPDIIIGSVVANNPNPPSVHDLLSQLENMLMVSSDYNLPEGANGIVLHPQVPDDLGVTDFSKNHLLIDAGYREVLLNIDSIQALGTASIQIHERQTKRQRFLDNKPDFLISDVLFADQATEGGPFAKAFLKPHKESIPIDEFKSNYYRLLSLDKYRHIYPRLHYRDEHSAFEVELDLVKNHAFHRSFGGNLSSKPINQFFADFAYERLGKYPITLFNNYYIGNYYNSGKLGIRVDFLEEKPFYLLSEISFSRWNYSSGGIYLFEEQKPSFIIQHELLRDLKIVFPWQYNGKWETGVFSSTFKSRYYNTNFFSSSDTTDLMELKPIGLYTTLKRSTLNHIQYPTSGHLIDLTARIVHAKEIYEPGNTSFSSTPAQNTHNWWELSMKWEQFYDSHKFIKPALMGELFLSQRPLLTNYSASQIMARQYSPFAFARTRYLDAFRANHFIAVGTKACLLLSRNWMIQGEAHIFHSFREIVEDVGHSARYAKNNSTPPIMYHSAIVYHTPMGPLSAQVSYFGKKKDPFTFVINFGYILFNNKTF
jgi:NTE family protein